MLTRVEIKKFKSCENLVLDGLGRITALVGRNGAGKTNILQAIDWAARSATRVGPAKSDPWPGLGGVTVHLMLPCGVCIYRIEVHRQYKLELLIRESLDWVDADGVISPVFHRHGEKIAIGDAKTIQIGAMSAAMPALLAILPADALILDRVRPAHAFLQAVQYSPLDEPTRTSAGRPIVEGEYEKWRSSGVGVDDLEDSAVYRLIQMKLENPIAFDEIGTLLGPSGLGLIDGMTLRTWRSPPDVGSSRTVYFLDFNVGGHSEFFSWDQLSLGTRRIVHLLGALVFDRSSVMLIEHPEDGIHRGLLHKLIGLLKTYSDPTQVILASHSGVVLNSLAPEEVRLVSMNVGKTTLRSLSKQEIELATHFLEEEGTLEDFLETNQQED